ncbi:MAG: hypothetical protein NT061_10265 [Spirochaetes bacterium]|nr:hypothetical protein [Spirochaetota bacterium]
MEGQKAMEHGERLGFWQAASIVAGYGIGGGILASYCLSLVLHLIIAELSAGDGSGCQIIELLDRYLFTGKGGKALTWVLFVLMGLAFLAHLAAYVAGGREVFAALGMGDVAGSILFYALAAVVAALGLRALGLAESMAVAGMVVVFAVLAGITLAWKAGLGANAAAAVATIVPREPASPSLNRILALYGMAMFSFAAFFSVPQAVRGLADKPKLIVPSVAAGLGINLAVILAMLTSYWSIAQALASILRERLCIGQFPAFLAATLPTLALSFLGGFLAFMRTAGGGIAVLVAVLILPTYARYRRSREKPAILPGVLDYSWIGWVAAAAYILMAVGSMVPIR